MSSGEILDPKELEPHQRWSIEIEAAEKELEKFHKRARKTVKAFLDDRDSMEYSKKWFNIFYANTQILESALYAQLPKPVVERKYKDFNDDVARVAGMILQRSITEDLDDPTDTFDGVMRSSVQDRLIAGAAIAWVRLETDTIPLSLPPTPGSDADISELTSQDTETGESITQEVMEQITDQRAVIDYVNWEDFIWSPCRTWDERRWIGRKCYMDKQELIKRFGLEKALRTPMNYNSLTGRERTDTIDLQQDVLQKAVVYEIWDRVAKTVIWYVKGMQELLDEKADFLKLTGFEPCPRPMLANVTTSSTIPRPDYYMIQDQYEELNTINNRISKLVQACKVVGVYDKSAGGISRMLTEGFDNQLVPVDQWAMFAEKGGLKGSIDWLPLEQVVQALTQLNQAREAIKGQIYELTGIADIVRGASKASETLGAQQIKAQYASVRIKKLQDEVARYAADLMRIKAEIMVRHFDPAILVKKSNILATGDQHLVDPAIQLLKSVPDFEWRVEVNADSLAQADYAADKTDRLEFMGVFSKFMQQFAPMLEGAPQLRPLLMTMLKWSVSGFRNIRDVEGVIDRELDRLMQEAKNPPPPKPDPEMIKAQMEMQQQQQTHQMEMQMKQFELQAAQQEAMMQQQQQKMEMALEQQARMFELKMDQQAQQQELHFEMLMNMIKLESARDLAEVKLETAHAQAEIAEDKAESAQRRSTND